MKQAVRFDVKHKDLCPALRWKGWFIPQGEDMAVPGSSLFWCVFTQTCVGPDGQLAEPHVCSVPARSCHRGAVAQIRGDPAHAGERR